MQYLIHACGQVVSVHAVVTGLVAHKYETNSILTGKYSVHGEQSHFFSSADLSVSRAYAMGCVRPSGVDHFSC